MAAPYASCIDCCTVLCSSYLVNGGGGGCSCMFLVHPVPTSAKLALTFGPCVLTFAPCILTYASCACGVSLLSTGANIPLAQEVGVTSCNLRWWCFFIQPLAQTLYLHLGNLHCVVWSMVVVVVCEIYI